MTDVTWFLLSALATWRLAHMLVREDGPWSVFARVRYAVGIRKVVVSVDSGMEAVTTTSNTVAEGLTCVWCVSVWTAVLFAVPWEPVRWVRDVLAVSAVAVVVEEVVTWLRSPR